MSEALILIDHAGQSAIGTAAARELIQEALASGALIGHVRDEADNAFAVAAQTTIKGTLKQIEEAYRAAKDPLVKLGRQLDSTFRDLTLELKQEYGRIGNIAGQFALAESRRVQAEAIGASQLLEKLEAEKHAAIAATPDPVKQVQLLEDYSRRAAAETPIPSAPTRAKGQRVREDWEIKVISIIECAKWALLSGKWDVLDITIRVGVVKELLNGGMTSIPGLKCKRVVSGSVTLPKAAKIVDV